MLVCVPDVLSKTEVAEFRGAMDEAAWEDGRSTAGAQSALVKKNEQLPPKSDIARELSAATAVISVEETTTTDDATIADGPAPAP